MKHFFVTVELWVRLLLSIFVSEVEHHKERGQRVKWWRLVSRCWKVRKLLARIVRGDPTYIKTWTWDEGPYLDFVEFNGEAVTLLDMVTSTWVMRDWYFSYVTWDKMSIPAPWVDRFYGLGGNNPPYSEIVKAPIVHKNFEG